MDRRDQAEPRARRRLALQGDEVTGEPSTSRPVVALDGGARTERADEVVVEEPLEIRVDGEPVTLTMRTPGHDAELALGFLLTEGVIEHRDAIASIAHGTRAEDRARHNVIEVTLRDGTSFDAAPLRRAFHAASACGVCGKSSIEQLRVRGVRPLEDTVRVPLAQLLTLPDAMRAAQRTFDATGGLHAAALFTGGGELVALREDVGRHNATDAVIGRAALEGRALAGHVLLVSGRAGFEIVQKVAVAGIPILASVSAPSSLAVDLAVELGVTLVGFLRPPRATIYAHAERIT